MKIFFIFLFILTIIAPFLYFLHLFHDKKIMKYCLEFLSFFSFGIMMIKIFFQPHSHVFFVITEICQFYIIVVLIAFILCLIYQLIAKHTHLSFHRHIMIYIMIFSIIYTSIGYVNHYNRVTTHYDVTVNKECAIDQMKIAMVSDIHLGSGTYLKDIQKLVYKFNNYDIVCLVGDIFDESTPSSMIEETIKELSQIKTTYGIYAVEGNHESYTNFNLEKLYSKYNIQYLQDNYVCIDHVMNIVGRKDISLKSLNTQEIFQNIDTTLPTLVLDHNPRRYKETLEYADLQLSGHTHGGQAFPLTLITNILFDNDYGMLKYNRSSLVVSSGYGSWGFPVRVFTHSEYVDIMVTFCKK